MRSPPRLSDLVVCVLCESRAFAAGIRELLRSSQCKVVSNLESGANIILVDAELGAERVRDCITSTRSLPSSIGAGFETKTIAITSDNTPQELLSWVDMGVDDLIEKSHLRDSLVARIVLLTRRPHKHVPDVGPISHELANAVSILDGKCSKLVATHPHLESDPDLGSMKDALKRMTSALKDLRRLTSLD